MSNFEWGQDSLVGTVVSIEGDRVEIRGLNGVQSYSLVCDFRPSIGDHISLSLDEGSRIQSFQVLSHRCIDRRPFELELNSLKRWCEFLTLVRGFFSGAQFLETPTPTVVCSSGTETHLQPFALQSKGYLPTSPEFSLKKYLSIGAERIFEIRSCHRNEDSGPHHFPEFTMLEWYRAYSSPPVLIEDVKALVEFVCANLPVVAVPKGSKIVTMAELFEAIGMKLTPVTSELELREFCREIDLDTRDDDLWDDLFFRIFIDKIEPHFDPDFLMFVCGFPPQLAAYARISESGWADRFEVYFQGLELGNAYNELIDPVEQNKRFEIEAGRSLYPIPADEDFLAALKWGVPPCSGIAMGLERLYMALFSVEDIRGLPIQAVSCLRKG